jgi:hypothetical protein
MSPVVSTSAAPAPAMNRPVTSIAKFGAHAQTRLPPALTTPPSASTARRPNRSAS